MSDVADSSGCFRQPEMRCSLLVMPLPLVFRGNNCNLQSFWEESHITDAGYSPDTVSVPLYVPFEENLNGRQVGIMANDGA